MCFLTLSCSRSVVQLEDCTFHRCVRLRTFDSDRTITFVPPDGEFELMKYRITDNINLPFRILPVIEEAGRTRMLINVKVGPSLLLLRVVVVVVVCV